MCSGPHMGARAPWQEMGQRNASPDIILTSGPWWSPVLHPSECSGQLLERPWVHVVSLEYPDKLKPLKQQHMFMIIKPPDSLHPCIQICCQGKGRRVEAAWVGPRWRPQRPWFRDEGTEEGKSEWITSISLSSVFVYSGLTEILDM